MRHSQAAVVLVCLALTGCFTGQGEYTALRIDGSSPLPLPSSPDMVHLEFAVIERSCGDEYLNRGLWELADEQIVTRERPDLSANGFRISQIGGQTPAGLLALLTSPRSNPDPRGVEVHVGEPVPVPLGPACKDCRYRLHQDDTSTAVAFDNARCFMILRPTLTEDGKVRLQFTPQVRHGKTELHFAPQQEPSGAMHWQRQEEQREEDYEHLAWEMIAGPGEFVVIGMRSDRMGTLGQACFLPATEDGPRMQRLLVVRAGRPASSPLLDEISMEKSPPLALRAAMETVRGAGD
jgi:hypothetical protein